MPASDGFILQTINISHEATNAMIANATALFDSLSNTSQNPKPIVTRATRRRQPRCRISIARQDNADRGKQAQLLLVGKISGMTDWRRRSRQDIDSADGKCENVTKIHAWNRVFRAYGQSVWHNDNDERQHLHDQPTEGKVRAKSPCHAGGRKHEVGDQDSQSARNGRT